MITLNSCLVSLSHATSPSRARLKCVSLCSRAVSTLTRVFIAVSDSGQQKHVRYRVLSVWSVLQLPCVLASAIGVGFSMTDAICCVRSSCSAAPPAPASSSQHNRSGVPEPSALTHVLMSLRPSMTCNTALVPDLNLELSISRGQVPDCTTSCVLRVNNVCMSQRRTLLSEWQRLNSLKCRAAKEQSSGLGASVGRGVEKSEARRASSKVP